MNHLGEKRKAPIGNMKTIKMKKVIGKGTLTVKVGNQPAQSEKEG